MAELVKVKALTATMVAPDGLHSQSLVKGQVISLPLQLAAAMVRDKLVEEYIDKQDKIDADKEAAKDAKVMADAKAEAEAREKAALEAKEKAEAEEKRLAAEAEKHKPKT